MLARLQQAAGRRFRTALRGREPPRHSGAGTRFQDAASSESLGPLICDLNWDEDQRLADWLAVADQMLGGTVPTVLDAAVAWDAGKISSRRSACIGSNLLIVALLRERGKVASQLCPLHAGLRHHFAGTA